MQDARAKIWSWTHLAAAFLLTFVASSPIASMATPHASKLQAQVDSGFVLYFNGLGIGFWFVCFLTLLPRRHNTSEIAFIHALGRLPLVAQFVLAVLLGVGLFCLGIACEKTAV